MCYFFLQTSAPLSSKKRQLPHAHILLFLHPSHKFPNAEDIDHIISAEISKKDQNSYLYELVSKHMIPGPCGNAYRSLPCMKDGRCSKFFPRKYQDITVDDEDRFPIYRRNTHHVVSKNGVNLDNCYVVLYNPTLLRQYRAYLNV